MNKNLIIYVDFDSTLYDTPEFAQDLWQLIAREANIPIRKVKEDAGDYFADKNLGGYDYDAHTRSYELNAPTMWSKLDELVNTKDYIYADSRAFIQTLFSEGYQPHILSFGETRFQTTKIKPTLERLAGEDNNLPFDVVMRKKNGHIAELHPGEQGVLIDDKPDQNLPNGFTEITLDRSSTHELPRQSGDVYTVKDLYQALSVIHSLSEEK